MQLDLFSTGEQPAHAKLSPSGAHRWLACPGSVTLEASIPDQDTEFSREGTLAHSLGELCLSNDCAPDAGVHIFDGVEQFVPPEMANYVADYVDYVRQIASEPTSTLLTEQRVEFTNWVPGGFGTADAIVIDEGLCHVIDLKYGQGVRVDARRNPQLMMYALGVYQTFGALYEIDTFVLTVSQPRLDHLDTWDITLKDLLAWANEIVKPAAEKALAGSTEFVPGEKQCRFCKARSTCRALAKHNYELTLSKFDDLDSPLEVAIPHTLSAEEIAQLLPKLPLLKSWAGDVEQYANDVLASGGVIPGFKLVEGRSLRQWRDDEEAANLLLRLGCEPYTQKVISPSQAEKALGKAKSAEIADLVTKPRGKPTLAPEHDPRPVYGAGAIDLL